MTAFSYIDSFCHPVAMGRPNSSSLAVFRGLDSAGRCFFAQGS
jgi:hypothetical protein